MKIIKFIVLFIAPFCIACKSLDKYAQQVLTIKFEKKSLEIDTLIDIYGFYSIPNCKYSFSKIIFFKDASLAQIGRYKLVDLCNKNNYPLVSGLFQIKDDTIFTQCITKHPRGIFFNRFYDGPIESNKFSFQIINRRQLKIIDYELFDETEKLFTNGNLKGLILEFTQMDFRPDSTSWLKECPSAWKDGIIIK